MEGGGKLHFQPSGFCRGPTGSPYTEVEFVDPPGNMAGDQGREWDEAKGEMKLSACEWAQVTSEPCHVAQGLTRVTFEYLNMCQESAGYFDPCTQAHAPSHHHDPNQPTCHRPPVCRVQMSPGAVPPLWHSPAQGKELAVAVERHIPQVEDLQPSEVAHIGDTAHLVALQVEASDLGAEASEGTGGNLQ